MIMILENLIQVCLSGRSWSMARTRAAIRAAAAGLAGKASLCPSGFGGVKCKYFRSWFLGNRIGFIPVSSGFFPVSWFTVNSKAGWWIEADGTITGEFRRVFLLLCSYPRPGRESVAWKEECFVFYLSQQPPIELFLCDFKLKQLGNFAAVPCKSILHSSPRAYGNSRGIVTHPREAELAAALLFSGRNVKWEFKKPLKKLGWCCFYFGFPTQNFPPFLHV